MKDISAINHKTLLENYLGVKLYSNLPVANELMNCVLTTEYSQNIISFIVVIF